MTCTTTITSTSNTLNNLAVNKGFHSFYIQRELDDKKDKIFNTLSAYVETLLKDTNHSSLLQEWKLNINASEYQRNIDASLYKPSENK